MKVIPSILVVSSLSFFSTAFSVPSSYPLNVEISNKSNGNVTAVIYGVGVDRDDDLNRFERSVVATIKTPRIAAGQSGAVVFSTATSFIGGLFGNVIVSLSLDELNQCDVVIPSTVMGSKEGYSVVGGIPSVTSSRLDRGSSYEAQYGCIATFVDKGNLIKVQVVNF